MNKHGKNKQGKGKQKNEAKWKVDKRYILEQNCYIGKR